MEVEGAQLAVGEPIGENGPRSLLTRITTDAQVLVELGDEEMVLTQDGGYRDRVPMAVSHDGRIDACGIRALLDIQDCRARRIELRIRVER